jgi:hypothetical protein
MKISKKLKKLKRRFLQYTVFSILLIFMLVGGWCVPPKWMEKVMSELNAKYTVEKIIEDDIT